MVRLRRSWLIPRLVHVGLQLQRRGYKRTSAVVFRTTLAIEPRALRARRELKKMKPRADGLPHSVRYVILGTTGVCNASCVHCPTGKAETKNNPQTPMPMEIFRKIIDGIADNGLA